MAEEYNIKATITKGTPKRKRREFQLSVSLSLEECKIISEKVKKLGLTHSSYLRLAGLNFNLLDNRE